MKYLLLLVIPVIIMVGGCNGSITDVAGILMGINTNVGVVSQQMKLDGWGFPSNVIELGMYSKDLVAAIAYAKSHPNMVIVADAADTVVMDEMKSTIKTVHYSIGLGDGSDNDITEEIFDPAPKSFGIKGW
jgi:hypothetical protein